MIFHDEYADVPDEAIEAFVREQALGRLVTVGSDGRPHIGLYPFLHDGSGIEMHLHRNDEQLTDLVANPHCVFELDDVLAVIPSYWVHPESAVMATAYHRTVVFVCEAMVSRDGAGIAAQQERLLARYQPEGGYHAVDPEHPLYRGAIASIAAVRLAVVATRVKWKLGQNRPVDARARVARELRTRGRPDDVRAADALQWTIDHEAARRTPRS